jgi:ABC-type glycerol-3-phosphate transport system substrate-binding protein
MLRPAWVALALSLALATSAFGQDGVALTRTSLQIAVWGPRQGSDYRAALQMARSYQVKHPAVMINIRHLPDLDAYATLQRWCGKHKNEATDMVVLPDQWLDEFAPSLLTVDKGLLAQFIGPVRARLTRRDKACGVPWIASVPALVYRVDAFRAAKLQPPTTWDELAKAAQAVAKPGKMWGFGLPVDRAHSAQMLLLLLRAEGGEPLTPDGKLRLSTPELSAALTRLGALAQSGGCQPETLSWSQEELAEAFAGGRLAAAIANRQTERVLSRRNEPPAYAVAKLPRAKKAATLASISCLAGLSTTANAGEVAAFLKFVASGEGQKVLCESGDSVPCQEEVIRATGKDALLQPFVEALKEASFLPPFGEPFLRLTQVYDWLACEVIKGSSTATEALTEADKATTAGGEPKPGPQVD